MISNLKPDPTTLPLHQMLSNNKELLKLLPPNTVHSMDYSGPIKAITEDEPGFKDSIAKMPPTIKIDPTALPLLQMLLSNKQILKSLFPNMGHSVDYSGPMKAITKEEHDSQDNTDDVATQHENYAFSNPLYFKLKENAVQNAEATDDSVNQNQNYAFSNPLYFKLKEKNVQSSEATDDIANQNQNYAFSNPLYYKLKEEDVQNLKAIDDIATQHENYAFSNPLYFKLKQKNDQDEEGKRQI